MGRTKRPRGTHATTGRVFEATALEQMTQWNLVEILQWNVKCLSTSYTPVTWKRSFERWFHTNTTFILIVDFTFKNLVSTCAHFHQIWSNQRKHQQGRLSESRACCFLRSAKCPYTVCHNLQHSLGGPVVCNMGKFTLGVNFIFQMSKCTQPYIAVN